MLKIKSLYYTINKKKIINNISLSVSKNDITTIVGPNGSGKSTLIKLISNEINLHAGEIIFLNKSILKWNINEIAKYRSVLPQSNHLSFPFTVSDVIKMGRFPYIENKNKSQKICNKLVEVFDIENNINQNYTTLSGGEKQRVQLARVIGQIWSDNDVYENKLLLLDEPTSYLDIKHQHALFNFLNILNKKGLTIIMVLHDLNHAISYSNKIILMRRGEVVDFGPTDKIINEKNLTKVFNIKLNLVKTNDSNRPIITFK